MSQEASRGNDVLRSVCLVAIAWGLWTAPMEAAVEVYPETVRLTSRRSHVQLVITSRGVGVKTCRSRSDSIAMF